MLIQQFSNYLLEKKVITMQQFDSILEAKAAQKHPLGELAVAQGFMTKIQVEITNQAQAFANLRFGDIAVAKNFLSEVQLQKLLSLYQNDEIILHNLLGSLNILSPQQTSTHLDEFKASFKFNETEFSKLLSESDSKLAVEKIGRISSSSKMFIEYASSFVNMVIRFIDRDVVIHKHYTLYEKEFKNLIYQGCKGAKNVELAYSSPTETMVALASSHAKEIYTCFDSDCIDSLKEFLNCISGLFVSALEKNQKLDYDLYPPRYYAEKIAKQVWVLPITTKIGLIEIIYKD